MEPLQLKQRHPVEEVECWDDDGDLQADDFHFRTTSVATTATSSHQSHHRESIASRLSIRSDVDSHFGDEERQLILPGDDEASTVQAIASAINAGIPIPANVPTSALVGGTIKRLGGKKSRKVIGDDWGDDLEIPKIEDGGLTIKRRNNSTFPDVLRHVSGEASYPDSIIETPHKQSANTLMDQFRDQEDEDDFLGDVPTIKVTKRTPRKPIPFMTPQSISFNGDGAPEDFEKDLEFPDNGEPLKLSARKEVPKTPALNQDEFDEWAEGSLGTRHGGTRRDRQSGRSSSISVMSPSVSSSFTAESEDDGLDGLVLPDGPVDFKNILERRQSDNQDSISVKPSKEPPASAKTLAAKDDFFSGLEVGDGDVFDSGKLTLNRNIKHKSIQGPSPARRTAMSITFTNRPTTTRLPRPRSGHERSSTSKLEPVTEAPDANTRSSQSQSRLSHSVSGSPSAIPVPAQSKPTTPSTPSRSRGLGTRPSMKTLRPEATTTAAQLLKAKRSMPSMRTAGHTPAKVYTSSQRPPSRQDGALRSNMPPRPKTPIERSGAESSLAHARRHPVPFLPAGTSHSQHVTAKSSRSFHRHDSESSAASAEHRSTSRLALSRATMRSPSPKRRDLAPDSLAKEAAAKSKLIRPRGGRRLFGDGNELELFDDLPTSTATESKFVKQPIGRGAPRALRSRLGQANLPDRSLTPAPSTTPSFTSPAKQDYTPRFARDTNASRIAREQRVGSSAANHPPLASVSTNWKAQAPSRPLALGSPSTSRGKRRPGGDHQIQSRPHLIKPLGDSYKNPKTDKSMHYNPLLFRWEGNENVLAPFDTPTLPPNSVSPVHQNAIPGSKADRQVPALITNIGTTQGVQVHGGMVFDPIRMCWLKLSHHQKQQQQRHSRASSSNPMSPIATATEDDEDSDDPFAGLEDLEDIKSRPGTRGTDGVENQGALENDDWLVGEEFDVGPEFVRRQREEEERWRRKVEKWVRPDNTSSSSSSEDWRWAFRSLVPEL